MGTNSLGQREAAGALHILRDAESLYRQGKLDDAARRYEAILLKDPKHFDALHRLGVLRAQQGKLAEGERLLQRAVDRNPGSSQALNNLGMTLNLRKRSDAAVEVLEKAIAIEPKLAAAHNNLGIALEAVGRRTEAGASFERALALDPRYADAANNLATLHLQNGHADDARRTFEVALGAAPNNPAYYVRLFQSYKVGPDDPHLAKLEDLARRSDTLSIEQRAQLHFALAKAYGDIGQNERAFDELLAGSALKRRLVVYDEAQRLQRFERIRTVFTPELFSAKAGGGSPSEEPIFILGMMRSGSTLVEQILASHPLVHAAGELPFFNDAYSALQRRAPRPLTFPDAVRELSGDDLRQLADDYGIRLRAQVAGTAAQRITDKMPGNFTAVGLIHLAFPKARIIHTIRDPIDTCLSCFATLFHDDQPFTYDLAELGRYYRSYAALMDHWRRVLPPDVMIDVQYERLVDNFEPEARRILAHCGLAWDDACLSFFRTERPVKTASATQVRRPIYRDSIGRWRPDPTILRPLIEGLGA